MITRETDYALRAILYLSGKKADELVSAAELSEEMNIPYRFLRKILYRLVEEGLLTSKKGKNGGLTLAKDQSEISIYDVANIFDPLGITLNLCVRNKAECLLSGKCAVHKKLEQLQLQLDSKLKEITFEDLK